MTEGEQTGARVPGVDQVTIRGEASAALDIRETIETEQGAISADVRGYAPATPRGPEPARDQGIRPLHHRRCGLRGLQRRRAGHRGHRRQGERSDRCRGTPVRAARAHSSGWSSSRERPDPYKRRGPRRARRRHRCDRMLYPVRRDDPGGASPPGIRVNLLASSRVARPVSVTAVSGLL
jgi:hypothetical protein